MRRYAFSRVGVRDPDVLVGPAYGEDAAIIRVRDELIVVHCDPITGAVENMGWLAVYVACNDIAVRGARPRWLLPVIYLPFGSGEGAVDRQVDEAAREVGAMVVGGHTEYTYGLDGVMMTMTAIGVCEGGGYVVTSGARPGDVVLMTKAAGVEGASILASDFEGELGRMASPQTSSRGLRFSFAR